MTQLTIPGTPKAKGGSRQGAGRKKKALASKTIRVASAIAFDCKRIDEQFRAGAYKRREECIIIPTPVHAGTRPWLRKYAEDKGLSENEAACDLLATALAEHFPEMTE